DDPSGAWERVTATPLPALVVSRHGGHYLLVDDVVDVAGTVSYRLVEHEAWGGTLIHGPWTVDFAARNESRLDVDGPAIESAGLTWWPWRRLTDRFVGRGRSTTLEPSSVVARHDTRARRRELALTTVSPSSARSVNDARLFTTEPALYEVGVETLADVLGMRATELRDLTSRGGLRLTVGGEPIAYRLDTVADRVVFAVDAHTSLESLRNVVQVTRGQGVVMPIVEEAAPPLAGQVGTFRDTVVVEDDVWLLPWANREEGTDPWYWDFTFAPSTPSTVLRFDVPDPSGVGEVRARIVMRGASDLVAGDDHRAWVSIDGVALAGEVTWDGFDRVSLEISFDAAWLGDGENVELTLHTTAFGEATSLVLIDHLELDYSRRLRAVDGSLWIDHLEPGVTTVGGFTSPTIRVVESPTESARTVERRDLTVAPDGAGGWQVSFVVDRAATYVVSERERAVHAETDRVPPWARQRRSAGAEYVIIAPRSLAVGAEALATYRADRFAVETIWLDDVYDRFSFGRTDSRALERLLEEVWRTWDPAPRYVVLLGRGTHDHRDRQGFGDSVLPMRFASTPWGLYASDGRYADVDDDKVPDFALGRIAALDDEDVLAYVDKLRRFEASAAAGTMLLVADNPDLAGDFHANNDDLTRQLDAMGRSSRRLDHPIDPIRSELLATWADGSLSLINYTGHGAATQLASEGFLTVGDIDSWQAIDRPPVFTAWTCAVGDSTTPGLLGLADALVLAPGTGAIATVTPAGLSLDVPAHELNTFFFDAFIDDAHALGDAHRLMHEWGRNGGVLPWMLDVYFVAGDPAITLDP
ncbi:MAG: C25 family cysteine peptidase, partial [Acidobacteriota bacterium]